MGTNDRQLAIASEISMALRDQPNAAYGPHNANKDIPCKHVRAGQRPVNLLGNIDRISIEAPLFSKISHISHKNMTFSRFFGVFCLALLDLMATTR
jgi:hypothetical protein